MPSRSGRNSRSKSSSRSANSRSRTSSRGSRRGSTRSSGSSRSRSAGSKSASTSSRSRSTSARSSRSGTTARSNRGAASSRRSSSASSRPLTDHDEIRQWAEGRGARPACVRGTGGGEDVGMIRLDFPGYSGEQSLEPIEWDEWFQKFDESGLALLVQETTARGQKSNFNKLVSRETASSGRNSSRRKSSSGSRGQSSRRRAA
jgi:hypothetical protein